MTGLAMQLVAADPSVLDAAIVDVAGHALCLLVPAPEANTRTLRERVRSRLPEGIAIGFVTVIPRAADGTVDPASADAIAVDERVRERVRRAVLGLDPVAEVEFAPVEAARRLVHVDALSAVSLPGDRSDASPRAQAANGVHSLVVGPPLRSAGPRTLPEALAQAAASERGVIFVRPDGSEHTRSYRALEADAKRIAVGLRERGVQPGDAVLLQCAALDETVTAFWAVVLAGAIALPLPRAIDFAEADGAYARLLAAVDVLRSAHVLADRAWLDALTASRASAPFRAHALDDARTSVGGSLDPAAPDRLALMLMTSGSTGRPKLVEHTHASVLANARAAIDANGFHGDDVSLNWFPLDHVGGLVMFHLRDVVAGCTQVQVPTSYVLEDVLRWLDLLARHGVTISWAPNFAYGLVASSAAMAPAGRWDLSRVRFLLNGGEAIVPAQARAFLRELARQGLSEAVMHPAWGMSETASGIVYSHAFRLATTSDADPFAVVGRPVPGASMRVVDDAGHLVPEGVIGALEVRGPQLMRGYHGDPEASAALGPGGWLRTGDLARIVGGELTITGRAKDTIIVNGANFAAHEIEAVVERVAGLERSYTAAFAARRPGDATDRLCLAIVASDREPASLRELVPRVRQSVLAALGVSPAVVLPLAAEQIPKTGIGKIQRSALRAAYEAGAFDEVERSTDLMLENNRTVPAWFFAPEWVAREGLAVAGSTRVRIEGQGPFTDALRAGAERCGVLDPTAQLRVHVVERHEDVDATLARFERLRAELTGGAWTGALVLVTVGERRPTAALLPALLRVAAEENAGLRFRHIEVDGAADDAEFVLAELAMNDARVARIGAKRFVAAVREAIDRDPVRRVLRPRDTFVLIGGAGGIGSELAVRLRRELDARLVIVGRRRREALDERMQTLVAHDAVRYVCADASDRDALFAAVESAADALGAEPQWIVNLAGSVGSGRLASASRDELREVIAARVRSSDHARELATRYDATLVLVSSVHALIGGAGLGAYAAACAYQAELAQNEPERTVAFLSGLWPDIGLSRGRADVDAARARGYLPLNAREGWISWRAVVERGRGAVAVGLDAAHPAIARRTVGRPAACEEIVVRTDAAPAAVEAVGARVIAREPRAEAHASDVRQSVEAVWCRVLELDRVAADADFFALGGHSLLVPTVRDELERRTGVLLDIADFFRFSTAEALARRLEELRAPKQAVTTVDVLAAIWRDVLELSSVAPTDDFFALGGHSLLVPSVHERVQKELGVDLGVAAIFRTPVLAALAAHVDALRRAPAVTTTPAPSVRAPDRSALLRQRERRGGHG